MEREVDLRLGVDLTLVQTSVPLAGVGKVKTPGVARPLQGKEYYQGTENRKLWLCRLHPVWMFITCWGAVI